MEDPCRSRFWARPVARGQEPMQEQGMEGELLPGGDPGWSSVLLRDGPCGTEPYWSSSRGAAACGKPTLDQFGKDGIP